MCIEMIEELDTTLQVAAIFVPADGDCMAWALRCLFCGAFVNQNYKSKASVKSCLHVRNIVSQMWHEKAADELWKKAFRFCYQDYMLDEEPEPGEHVSEPKSKPKNKRNARAARAARAAAVPVAARDPVDATLKAPSTVHERFMDPPVPDLEEVVSKSLLKNPKSKSKVMLEEEAGEEPEDLTVRKNKPHTRMMKRKPLDIMKLKERRLIKFLASKQLTNGDFMRLHKRSCILKKAGVCPEGSFQHFRAQLLAGTLPGCEVCQGWMTENGVLLENIQEMLREVEAQTPGKVQPEEEEKGDDQVLGDVLGYGRKKLREQRA